MSAVAENPNPQKIPTQNGQNGQFWSFLDKKNSNSRKNLGPGTKSDFIFELSVVDLGGTPYLLGFYSAFLKSDLWSLSESAMTHNLIFLWSLDSEKKYVYPNFSRSTRLSKKINWFRGRKMSYNPQKYPIFATFDDS